MSAPSRSMLPELVATVVFPTVVLIGFTGEDWLGPRLGLVVALAAPLGWGIFSMVRDRTVSALAVIALVSVLLTGSVGLLELDPQWFALKEAAVPLVLGGLTMATAHTRFALLPVLFERVLDTDRVDEALDTPARDTFDAASRRGTVLAGGIVAGSALLSWGLARYLVTSPSGSEAFASELGTFTTVSFFAVGVPTTLATAWVLRGVLLQLEDLAGVDIETLLQTPD
ncbi:MAG: VC0807 family protein [Myxococcota bacterium]